MLQVVVAIIVLDAFSYDFHRIFSIRVNFFCSASSDWTNELEALINLPNYVGFCLTCFFLILGNSDGCRLSS